MIQKLADSCTPLNLMIHQKSNKKNQNDIFKQEREPYITLITTQTTKKSTHKTHNITINETLFFSIIYFHHIKLICDKSRAKPRQSFFFCNKK